MWFLSDLEGEYGCWIVKSRSWQVKYYKSGMKLSPQKMRLREKWKLDKQDSLYLIFSIIKLCTWVSKNKSYQRGLTEN